MLLFIFAALYLVVLAIMWIESAQPAASVRSNIIQRRSYVSRLAGILLHLDFPEIFYLAHVVLGKLRRIGASHGCVLVFLLQIFELYARNKTFLDDLLDADAISMLLLAFCLWPRMGYSASLLYLGVQVVRSGADNEMLRLLRDNGARDTVGVEGVTGFVSGSDDWFRFLTGSCDLFVPSLFRLSFESFFPPRTPSLESFLLTFPSTSSTSACTVLSTVESYETPASNPLDKVGYPYLSNVFDDLAPVIDLGPSDTASHDLSFLSEADENETVISQLQALQNQIFTLNQETFSEWNTFRTPSLIRGLASSKSIAAPILFLGTTAIDSDLLEGATRQSFERAPEPRSTRSSSDSADISATPKQKDPIFPDNVTPDVSVRTRKFSFSSSARTQIGAPSSTPPRRLRRTSSRHRRLPSSSPERDSTLCTSPILCGRAPRAWNGEFTLELGHPISGNIELPDIPCYPTLPYEDDIQQKTPRQGDYLMTSSRRVKVSSLTTREIDSSEGSRETVSKHEHEPLTIQPSSPQATERPQVKRRGGARSFFRLFTKLPEDISPIVTPTLQSLDQPESNSALTFKERMKKVKSGVKKAKKAVKGVGKDLVKRFKGINN